MVGLGNAGLTPFYLFAGLSWVPIVSVQMLAQRGFVVYSMVILAFLAGSLWGSANVRDGADKTSRLLTSNLLAVLGAGVVILATPLIAAIILAGLHLAQLRYEIANAAPGWYLALRQRLTWLSMPAYALFLAAMLL